MTGRDKCLGGTRANHPPLGMSHEKEVLNWFTLRIGREPRMARRLRQYVATAPAVGASHPASGEQRLARKV